MEIKVRYIREVMLLEQKGDWIDLRCGMDIYMTKGQYMAIPLGVAIELPKGYEAIVAPRSSTFKNYGILMCNSIGVIDEAYCGNTDEWRFPAYATDNCYIPINARIAQFRIIEHQPEVELRAVDFLGNADRGGLGSTGRF